MAFAIALGLAAIPYNYGTGRWRAEWAHSLRGISIMMLVLLLPWFVVTVVIGADLSLVPIVIVLFPLAWGIGYFQRWPRARRARRARARR